MTHVREQIRMTEDEMWAFLDEVPHLHIATLNGDGSPHMVTMRFAIVERAVVFHSYAKAQKVVNLERDSRIALLAEAGYEYEELRGVSINASAEIVTDADARMTLGVAVRRRYDETMPLAEVEQATRKLLAKRTVVRVRPERVVSWDHRKLASLGRSY